MTGPFGRGLAAQRFAKANPAAAQQRSTSDLQTLRDAPAQLQQIRNQHEDALTKGRNTIDGNTDLSDSGRASGKATVQANVTASTQSAIDAVRQKVQAAHSALMGQADRTRPQPVPGVEGMLGRQAAWARARSLLDAGMAPQKLIAETTDPETLHALADELPTYLRSKGADPQTAQGIGRPIADRMGQVAGEPHASALLNAREAEVHMAGLQQQLSNAGAHADGAGPNIAGAVAASLARQRAAAGMPTDSPAAEMPAETAQDAMQYAVKPAPPAPAGDGS